MTGPVREAAREWHPAIRGALLLLSVLLCAPARPHSPSVTVIDVDAKKRELRVLQGGKVLAVFNPVSTGRWGVSATKRLGDGKTPLGEFRVVWEQAEGQFGPFLGIDYPSIGRAERALADNQITRKEYDAIIEAHRLGRVPPQHTRLGGHLGIHGLGRADPGIHRDVDWTQGCIAVTNEEMERLLEWAGIGTRVIIH